MARTKKKQQSLSLFQRLHHWLIPGVHNNFHPRTLRPVGLVVFALVIAFIPTLYNFTTSGRFQVLGYATNVTVGDLHALGNQERANAGVGALSLNGTLSQAAYNKARDMINNNYWAHTSPTGKTPWSFITSAGYGYATAGENLAKNFNTSAGVMYGWMNSSEHRSNVLNGAYKDVGYAVVNGTLLGEETTLVVAMYGAPYVAPAPAPTPPPAPVASTQPAPQARQPAPVALAAPANTSEEEVIKPITENPTTEQPLAAASSRPSQAVSTESTEDKNSTSSVAGESALLAPVRAYTALNWGQKASLFVISVLALLFVMKHTMIWRTSRRGLKDIWLRAHPVGQGSILVLAILVTFLSGTGSIL